jgi:hypothetical protein
VAGRLRRRGRRPPGHPQLDADAACPLKAIVIGQSDLS